MDTPMHRRAFVKSGALALVTLGLSPRFLRRTAFAAELAKGAASGKRKTLVCLFQRGAADALNVLVPHGESAYYRLTAHQVAHVTVSVPCQGPDICSTVAKLALEPC